MMDTVLRRLRRSALADGFGLVLVLAASLFFATGSWTVVRAEPPQPQLMASLDVRP
jgi:hypothetical protein